jgi:arylamine N-acetyltransferase
MDTPLSRVEAMNFVEKVLGIDTPEAKLSDDKCKFLNELVRSYVECIPFQNIHLLAMAYNGRNHVPLWPEIKQAMVSGCGGICFTVGVFMKVLLETLGYDVYFAACDIIHPSDHVSTVVRSLSYEGSEHLIDVTGYPNFVIFPLNFTETSSVYNLSFCTHYFKRIGEKTIQRYNVKGMDGQERLFGTFHIQPQELQHFSLSMKNIYTNPDASTFLKQVMAISFHGGKCIAVRGSALLKEDDDCTLQKTIIDSKTTAEVLNKHFSQIPADIVADALAYLEDYRRTHACQ